MGDFLVFVISFFTNVKNGLFTNLIISKRKINWINIY